MDASSDTDERVKTEGTPERRAHRRRTLFLPVTLFTTSGATTPSLVCDLSPGGARVMPYFVRLRPGELVKVQFSARPEMPFLARVIWTSEPPASAAGLQFVRPVEVEPLLRQLLLDVGD